MQAAHHRAHGYGEDFADLGIAELFEVDQGQHLALAYRQPGHGGAHAGHGLAALGATNWLHVTLSGKAPASDGFGMNGSAMFIVNPPWTLERKLHETLPRLSEILAQDDGAGFIIESESA